MTFINPSLSNDILSGEIKRQPVAVDIIMSATFEIVRTKHNGLTLKEYAAGVAARKLPIMTPAEFESAFGPEEHHMQMIQTYAVDNGLDVVCGHYESSHVQVTGTVAKFNAMFNIQLLIVEPDPQDQYLTYQGSLTIPDELQGVLTSVFGLDQTFRPKKSSVKVIAESQAHTAGSVFAGAGPGQFRKPMNIAKAYKFPGRHDETDGYGQTIGILAPYGIIPFGSSVQAGYTQDNLNSMFLTSYGFSKVPNIVSVAATPQLGGNNPYAYGQSNTEVALDIGIAAGIAPAATTVVYFGTPYDSMNAAINDSLGTGYRPCVLSISVAWREIVASLYPGWDTVINAAVAKGITIVAASGDWGPEEAAAGQNTVCWPASNPYVLAVGGTSVNPVQDANGEYTSISSEVTWNDGTWYTVTGGGISGMYNVPAYQNGLTYTTFTKSSPTSLTGTLGTPVTLTTNAFNNDLNNGPLLGRAVPDIAMVADGANGCDIYTCYSAQLPNLQFPSNGTSAAAPAIAGLIARINQQRVTPVGYVNDIFYRNPNCFNDITVGNNSIQANVDLTGGYQTTIGYDACTGLGSPKGDALMTLFSSGTKVLTANGWSALTGIFVNVNGTWAPPVAIYTNVNGTWGPF